MKNYIFTDLACEAAEEICIKREKINEKLARAEINGEGGDLSVTYFTPRLWLLENDDHTLLTERLAREIRELSNKMTSSKLLKRILVVGLGNPRLTPDSLGSQTVEHILVTDPVEENENALMAIAPDVSGNTGIETLDAVRAYVDRLRPDIIIIIDSLRAGSYERLGATVQISGSGITPGSGVGNARSAITRASLGVPVISIGVPTVVSSSTLIYEAIEGCGASVDNEKLISLLKNRLSFLVMPKEADVLIKSAAFVIADAINSAFSGR